MANLMNLPGAVDLNEALFLEALVRVSRAKTIIETGCGLSTYYLTKGLGVIGAQGKVYVFEKEATKIEMVRNALTAACLLDWCEFIEGDSVLNLTQWQYPIDFAFVDSDHATDHVLNELGAIYKHLTRDGILVGHDLTHDSRAGDAYRIFAERYQMGLIHIPSPRGIALMGAIWKLNG